jgi:hypothetical protein
MSKDKSWNARKASTAVGTRKENKEVALDPPSPFANNRYELPFLFLLLVFKILGIIKLKV